MEKSQSPFSNDDVKVVARTSCHAGFLKIEQIELQHRLFGGGWSGPIHRELLMKDPAVGILLYDPVSEKVVLVRQFRVGIIDEASTPWLLELVAGMVAAGESTRQVAERECTEEANLKPTDLVKICDYFNSPGTSNEKVSLYCGRVDAANAGGVHGLEEEHEDIEVVVLDLKEATEAVEKGVINNAMTIIALQWIQLHKARLLSAWNLAP